MNVRLKRARELAGYAVQLTKDEGLGTMLARGAGFVRRRCFGKKARYLPAKKVLEAQRAEMAGKNFENCQLSTISVLTPLYNTPEVFLRQFLDSFVNQTAPNGELCLADASDAAHSSVGNIVREYQTKYQHIVYKKIENKGIAANTNAAAELASGEYLALADHDDILAPHAMYTMGQAIRQLREAGEPDGFLYSDEALFTKKIEKPLVAHFKPDYAPDYLLCCNYICHLAVFRRELFEQVGGERPECDGSQDHDLFLRLIEQVGGAAHVPQVLYYWRVHEGSTSGGTDAKPYVAKAAKKALADHLERTGRTGTIEDGLYPSTYRVRWDIVGEPKVSILIPNKDHTEDLEKCLQSIWKKTTWDRFEVIVIENNSTDPATFAYYEKARQRYDGLKVVTYPGKGFNFSAINNFGRKAAEGDSLAKSMLVQLWLPKVIETAKEMHTRDFFLMDLVQEGNVGLLVALESVVKAETAEQAIDAAVRETISDFMEEHRVQKHKDNTVVNKVNRLKDAIEELSDGDDMDFSVAELSAYLDMSVEEIEDILRIAGEEP